MKSNVIKLLLSLIIFTAITIFVIHKIDISSVGDALSFSGKKLYPIQENGKWGYMGINGKIVIQPQFDSAHYFYYNDIAVIRIGDKYNFIDKHGKVLSDSNYTMIREDFVDKAICVGVGDSIDNLRYGYVDRSFKYIISPRYDNAMTFVNGIAPVLLSNKWGYINKSGETICLPQFDSAEPFLGGLALVNKDNKYGFIDKKFEIKIPCIYDNARHFRFGTSKVLKGKYYNLIDLNGNEMLKNTYIGLGILNENLIPYKMEGETKWGYIDKNEHIVIPATFDSARAFNDGMASVRINDKWGYIDKKGTIVIKPQFTTPSDFRDGLAFVIKECSGVYINKTGDQIWLEDINNLISSLTQDANIEEPRTHIKGQTLKSYTGCYDGDSKNKELILKYNREQDMRELEELPFVENIKPFI